MFNVSLAGGHLYGKQLFTWLSLVVSLMASFVLSFFPLDVLDEIWDLTESVSEGFLTYSLRNNFILIPDKHLEIQDFIIPSPRKILTLWSYACSIVRPYRAKRLIADIYYYIASSCPSNFGSLGPRNKNQLFQTSLLNLTKALLSMATPRPGRQSADLVTGLGVPIVAPFATFASFRPLQCVHTLSKNK